MVIDCEKLKNPYSGLGQFCLNLGHALKQLPLGNVQYYVPQSRLGVFGSEAEYMVQKSMHKLLGVKTNAGDVFHATHQLSAYGPRNNKTKYVLTVHDLNFLYKYSGHKLQRKKKALQQKIDRADAITAISHFAATELRTHMHLQNRAITVIHNGNTLDTAVQPVKPAWISDAPFMFTIGIILPRKNFHVLLPLLAQRTDMNLVIAGDNTAPYAQGIVQEAKKQGLENRVMMPGSITDAEKLWLYQNAESFVFPSLAEGFGLPVAEAMSLGKPVFLNHATSLPEVGGELAFYWHDFDPANMNRVYEEGMRRFAQQQLAPQYIQHAAQFNWQNAAQQYAKVYASLR